LTALLLDAESGKFNVVVTTKIDRLSRSIIDFQTINKQLFELGVHFVSATQKIDTTTASDELMQNIFMAFAQFERSIISERTREGMYARVKQGFWTGRHVPLGYFIKDKRLLVEPYESKLVNKIFVYYLENPSCLEVSKRLNNKGYKRKHAQLKNNSPMAI